MSGQDLAVYAGNFDTQNPTSQELQTMQGYANDIGASGLTELVLWALHVDEATFSDPSVMTKGLNGGFLWNYGSILSNQASGTCAPKNTTADYAKAMKAGIDKLNGS